jgi:hypothetical protein
MKGRLSGAGEGCGPTRRGSRRRHRAAAVSTCSAASSARSDSVGEDFGAAYTWKKRG